MLNDEEGIAARLVSGDLGVDSVALASATFAGTASFDNGV